MLQVVDLKKSYPQSSGDPLEILDVPKYEVGDGEHAVLMGASGGGKTTFLHIISGITRATSGQVRIDGMETTSLSEGGRDLVRARKLGYVFQTFNLLPGLTAYENVLLGMSFGPVRRDPERAHELLERVGLQHRKRHRPGALSVGEQQRVAVARALANRPRLLLADEPTANVDPANQQKIIDLIREVCAEESVAMILVTHSVEVASQFERVDRLEDINLALKRAREIA